MIRCQRVGIEVTKRCNFRCRTCFYYWRKDFNSPEDKTLDEAVAEMLGGKRRGCDHAVIVGQGEPGLWKHLVPFIEKCRFHGVTTSIITNGSMPPERYAEMYEAGLDHLHVSVHGIGPVLDEIVGLDGAGEKQARTLRWLNDNAKPWRMNMTVQQANYKTLPDIARFCMAHGCKHIISLGFLPHYEWNEPTKLRTVAVDPREIEPYLNAVCDTVAERPDVLLTVRYHPMCHIDPKYRKYIVNARYVLYDPWEWEYGHAGDNEHDLRRAAENLGNAVAILGPPCATCKAFEACGGWNRIYASAYPGCVTAATDMLETARGVLHDQNPANAARGWFG